MNTRHLVVMLLIAGAFWATVFGLIALWSGADDEPVPPKPARVVATPEIARVIERIPDPTTVPDEHPFLDSPSTVRQSTVVYSDPKHWAKQDKLFVYCVQHPNGPWILIPPDASESDVETFKYLIKDIIIDRQSWQAYHKDDAVDQAWFRRARLRDLDDQERFANAFRLVWPNARQPDPVVR